MRAARRQSVHDSGAHLERGRIATQLTVGAITQACLLCGEAHCAVLAVEDEDGTDTRADDDAAADAVGDLHLLARVEDIDVAAVAALDLDIDAEARPARAARAGWLEVRDAGERLALNALARSCARATKGKGLLLVVVGPSHHGR